jgi:hypothetical protein
MDIFKFGDALIRSRDLDPVYCALYGAQLSEPELSLLLAYLAFYHLGFAAWLSEHEGVNYWQAMLVAAKNETPSPLGGRWPRSSERRHFRGVKCVNAVNWLRRNYLAPEGANHFSIVRPRSTSSSASVNGRCLAPGLDSRQQTSSNAVSAIHSNSTPISVCSTPNRALAWICWPLS